MREINNMGGILFADILYKDSIKKRDREKQSNRFEKQVV